MIKKPFLVLLSILLSGCTGFAIGDFTIIQPPGSEFDLEIDGGRKEIEVAVYQQPAKVVEPYVDQQMSKNRILVLPPWKQRYRLDSGDKLHVNVFKDNRSGPIEIKLALGSQVFKKITLPEGNNNYSFVYAPW